MLREEVGLRLKLHADARRDQIVSYPSVEAPNLMTHISEELDAAFVDTIATCTADTVLGAIVLARSGYGDALVPETFRHPLIETATQREATQLQTTLFTAVSVRSTDRRELVDEVFAIASDQAAAERSQSSL
ncbi:MAG: hypothetical protein AAGD43_01505 [Pseudomonadota bacterium]